ncbi:hypothetical protein ACFW04_001231 [Cataglyphis niger]
MFKFCLMILCLGYAGAILPPGILEWIDHFFLGFPPKTPRRETLDYTLPFDFVVIGAGSAGSALVNRLTENPNWNVLVLEEGNDENFLTDIPLFAPALHITDYARVYKSEPRPQDANGDGGYCLSMNEGRCNIVFGKAVGGTSVVNFMIYSRGAPADYDAWWAPDNPGWSYKDVLPYFIKSERCKLIDKDARYHGYDGYLDVTNPPYATPLKECFLKAGQELGYDLVDYNSDRLIGFSTVQTTLRNGHRVSAGKAFLRPILNRRNFYLSKFSTVTKIIINPKTKTAVGVEFMKNHKTYFVSATKEIILCAGALNSPQLLMLSGIGPKGHLDTFGIPVIEDLPVGFNLQDHVSMSALTFLVNESVSIVEQRVGSNPANFLDYLIQGTGPLTLPASTETLAFINTKAHLSKRRRKESKLIKSIIQGVNVRGNSERQYAWIAPNVSSISVNRETHPNKRELLTEDDYPDIELLLGGSSLLGDISGFYRNLLGLTTDFHKEFVNGYNGFDAFTLVPVLLRPKSRGRLTLRSTDPLDSPIIDLNYYDDEDDLNTMVQAIKIGIEIASTKAFKRYNATLLPVPIPGCRHVAFKSDPYWACVARHVSTTIAHFSGTCKMSTRRNLGVVDHRLRVHGIRGLRVVDASIMPTIIAGHTTAPAYMIAEKASDMIKEDWRDSTP